MYSNEYDDEQEQTTNGSFLKNFYNNNKVLVWIFAGIIIFILLMSILTKGGSNNKTSNLTYDVTIIPEGDVFVLLGKSTNLVASVKNDPKAVITWSVEDETIAKVDNGNVTGLDYGKTKVMATYIDGKNEKHTAYKEVTVAKGDPNVTLTDVSFKDGDLFMPLNATYQVALTLTPSVGYVESEKFTSSNSSVVTVDNNGLITAVGEGTATVTFDVNNGRFRKELVVFVDSEYDRTEIIVTPSNISFDGELRKIKIGTIERLTYTIEPTNADSDKLVWESSDENVLTVDNGKVKGISAGMAVVTVTALNGTRDRIDIEVESDIIPVTEIGLSTTELYMNAGQSRSIMPLISPSNASNKALSYTSLDSSVAYVTANGTGTQATITAVNPGNTTIVIRSTNNIEKRLNVIVSGGSQGGNGSSGSGNSGSSSGSSGSGSYTSNQGFKISSKDANWDTTHEGFIVTDHSRTSGNAATAPVSVTVQKTTSSVSKLVVLVCDYASIGGSCGSLGRWETADSVTFTLYNAGDYVIRVEEYNSNNTRTRSTDKFLLIGVGSSGGSSGSGSPGSSGASASPGSSSGPSGAVASYSVNVTLYDSASEAQKHPYKPNTKATISVAKGSGFVKACIGSCVVDSGTKIAAGSSLSYVLDQEKTYTIRIGQYASGSTTAYSVVTKYITIASGGGSSDCGANQHRDAHGKCVDNTPSPSPSATTNPNVIYYKPYGTLRFGNTYVIDYKADTTGTMTTTSSTTSCISIKSGYTNVRLVKAGEKYGVPLVIETSTKCTTSISLKFVPDDPAKYKTATATFELKANQ